MAPVKMNRPAGVEEWTSRGDRRNLLATVISGLTYIVPWLMFQGRWPLFSTPAERGQPPLSLILGMGIGWFAATVLLFVVVVPNMLARADRGELAWRWRGGALHAAVVGLVFTSVAVGMRLPVPISIQVLATFVLIIVEYFALRWLQRKLWDT
jgi:hypothetical protein